MIGPRPHGSFWLTAVAGVVASFVGFFAAGAGMMRTSVRDEETRVVLLIVGLIGVALPALALTLVFNFSWLFPNVHFIRLS